MVFCSSNEAKKKVIITQHPTKQMHINSTRSRKIIFLVIIALCFFQLQKKKNRYTLKPLNLNL